MTPETSREELIEAVSAELEASASQIQPEFTRANGLGSGMLAKLTGIAATAVMLVACSPAQNNGNSNKPTTELPSGHANENHEHCGAFYTCYAFGDGEQIRVNLYPNRMPVEGTIEFAMPDQQIIVEEFDVAPKLNTFSFPYPDAVKVTIKVPGEDDVEFDIAESF